MPGGPNQQIDTFKSELKGLIGRHVTGLGGDTISEVLETLSSEVVERPRSRFIIQGDDPVRAMVELSHRSEAEQVLADLLESRLLRFPPAPNVTGRADARVTLVADELCEDMILMGRVVHTSADGLLIHVDPIRPKIRAEMEAWIGQLRGAETPDSELPDPERQAEPAVSRRAGAADPSVAGPARGQRARVSSAKSDPASSACAAAARRPRRQASRRGGSSEHRGVEQSFVARRVCPPVDVNQLGLSLSEVQVYETLLDTPRSCQYLVEHSLLSPSEMHELVEKLEREGFVDLLTSVEQANNPSWKRHLQRMSRQIESIEALFEEDNPWSVMGLHWTAYDGLIVRRNHELCDSFSALNQPLGLEVRERNRLRKLRTRLNTIYQRLQDFEQRKQWRMRHLSATCQRDVAEQLEELAAIAMKSQQLQLAADLYQRLLEASPNHRVAGRRLTELLVRMHPAG